MSAFDNGGCNIFVASSIASKQNSADYQSHNFPRWEAYWYSYFSLISYKSFQSVTFLMANPDLLDTDLPENASKLEMSKWKIYSNYRKSYIKSGQ